LTAKLQHVASHLRTKLFLIDSKRPHRYPPSARRASMYHSDFTAQLTAAR
jgi:hypothetical protein